MEHNVKINEDVDNTTLILRDLVGDIKEEKKIGYYIITETTKGCYLNFELTNYLDRVVEVYNRGYDTELKDVIIRPNNEDRWGQIFNAYFEGNKLKILSTYPGDERGSFIFNNVFISSGHDGNYLWNVKTGEFKANTW